MGSLFGSDGNKGDEPPRRSWFGLNQRRPKLPYYLRSSKRLKSLDEFEEPEWKGRVRWPEDDSVTWRGIARDTLNWLVIFAIAGTIAGSFWVWQNGHNSCVELLAGFKVGWC